MKEFELVCCFQQLSYKAKDHELTITPGANSFLIQNRSLKILCTPTTLDGVSAYLDAVEYASRKNFTGFN